MELKLPYDMCAWIKEGSIITPMTLDEVECAAQASLLLDDEDGTITCEDKDWDLHMRSMTTDLDSYFLASFCFLFDLHQGVKAVIWHA